MHALLEIDGIQDPDLIPVLLQGMAAFQDDGSLGICDHIRAVHLE